MPTVEQRLERIEKKLRIYKMTHLVIAVIVGSVVTASAVTGGLRITSLKISEVYDSESPRATLNPSPKAPRDGSLEPKHWDENGDLDFQEMPKQDSKASRKLSKITAKQVVQDEVVTSSLKIVDANGNVRVSIGVDVDCGLDSILAHCL